MTTLPTPTRERGRDLAGGLVALAVIAALFVAPQIQAFGGKTYLVGMSVILFLAIATGQAWNVIGGYTGQYSVGHSAYWGIGAYTTVMLYKVSGIPPWWGVWAAAANGVLLSLVIGSITFRLRGPYFVLASIATAEVLRYAFLYFEKWTRGAQGFTVGISPKLPFFESMSPIDKRPYYYVTLVLAILCTAIVWGIQRSKLGYYFQAIREDQDAAHSLGINLAFYKSTSLAISAALTSFAGGVYVFVVNTLDPNIFTTEFSVQVVLVCIIGGIGTILGPVIGAMVLIPLSEVLRSPRSLIQLGILSDDSPVLQFVEAHLANAHLFIYGILVVLVILFAPDGVLGLLRGAAARLRRRREAEAPAPGAAGAPGRAP